MKKQIIKLIYPGETKLGDAEVVGIVQDLSGSRGRGQENLAEVVNKKYRPSLVSSFARGVKGLAKSMTGVGVAKESVIEERRAICEPCVYRNGKSCGKCGCSIFHKTRVSSEKCPMSYWGQEPT